MSMWQRQQRVSTVDGPQIPSRQPERRGLVNITNDTALRNSAVWACLRTRADLISSLPLDCFREVGGVEVEVPTAPVLEFPDGKHWPYHHWMWASEFDLDRAGNTIGVITERNALGLPARIKLYPTGLCSVYQRRHMDEHRYRIDGVEYTPNEVWHERQFPVAGLPVGLSPVAYAAWTLQENLSMQQFALDWFGGGGMPKAHLKNSKKSLDAGPANNEARRVKDRYNATISNGDVWVTGNDWEINFLQGQTMGQEWLEGRRATVPEVCRYFGCPADVIEAAIDAPGSITYQTALQRNLQLLVIHLGPAIDRREKALSTLLPRPRKVRLNSNALLRMDPETQVKVIDARIKNRTMTVTEGREMYNLPPLTPEQEEEFVRLFGAPRSAGPEQATAPQMDPRNAFGWEQVSPFSAAPLIGQELMR